MTKRDSSSEAFAIMEYERGVLVENTEFGLLFMIFGVLLSAVPIIGPIGILFCLIGITLLVLGRDPFGKRHSTSVIIAAAVFVIGTGFVLVGSILYSMFVFSIPGPTFPPFWWGDTALAQALVPHLTSIFAIEATGAILTGVAFAVLTFFLQKRPGRVLVVIAAATSIAISVLVFSILSSDVTTPLISGEPSLLYTYQNGWGWDVAWAFEHQVLVVGLLSVIPAIIYAAAYYSAYSHLE